MKTLLKIFIIMTLLLLCGLLSCGKNSNPLIETTEFTIENYPYEIGSVWQYQRDNRVNMSTDTLIVRITDSMRITDDSLLAFKVITENVNGLTKVFYPSYWHLSGDTVTYYRPDADSFKVYLKIVFPLEVGSNWSSGVTPPDSNEVTQVCQKTILGNSYQSCYQIVSTSSEFDEIYNDSYWYVPNIGLVQSEFVRDSPLEPAIINEIWNLISFHKPDSLELSQFPLQVNASWKYRVFDNEINCFAECYDTCIITILDSVLDRGGIIRSNWLFDYPDEGKVIINSLDQNKLFLQWHHYAVYFSLEFPLTVGKQWTDGALINSSVRVVGRQTVTTPAGTFKDAYYLTGYTRSILEPGANFEIWIAKDYGIVKLNHVGEPMGTNEDKTWLLNSYNQNKPAASFTIDKFPSYDFMTRTYEVFDNISQTYDTLIVQVAESSLVALWNYNSPDSSWLEIVSIEGTVAKFFNPDNMIEPFKSYEFPIEIGDSWVTYPIGNSSVVGSATLLLLSGERFFPCYPITTNYICGDGCIHYEMEWVCPLIGIVQKKVYASHLGIDELWRLIDYSTID